MTCHKDHEKCFIETHKPETENYQLADGSTVTYFEDFTDNHNKTAVEIEISDVYGPVMVTAVLETRDGKTIERPIKIVNEEAERAFQLENLCRVSLRGDSFYDWDGGYLQKTSDGAHSADCCPPQASFYAEVELEKTFCICCCKEDKHHHKEDKKTCGCSKCRRGY